MFQFVIEGGIGCRKTSILKKLMDQGIKTVQEPLGDYRHLLEGLFNPKRSFNCQMQIIISLHRHQQKEKFLNKQDIIVYERNLLSAKYVFIKCMRQFNLLTEEEVDTLNNTIDLLIDPHDHFEKIFYLRSSISRSMELIHTRGRRGEHLITEDYIRTLSKFYNEYLSHLNNVIIIDIDSLNNDEITQIIHSAINQSLPMERTTLPYWNPKEYPSFKPKPKKYQPKSNFKCYSCSQIGHGFRDCPLDDSSSSTTSENLWFMSRSDEGQNVKIERIHPLADIPKQFYGGDSGWDLSIPIDYTIHPKSIQKLRTGLKLTFPKNLYGIIHNRSSWPKFGMIVIIGILDTCFTGEVHVQIQNVSDVPIQLHAGDRVAQLVFHRVEKIQFTEDEMIQSTPTLKKRGARAFGSTNTQKREEGKQEEEETRDKHNTEDLTKDFENFQLNQVWREWNKLDEEEKKEKEEEEEKEEEKEK